MQSYINKLVGTTEECINLRCDRPHNSGPRQQARAQRLRDDIWCSLEAGLSVDARRDVRDTWHGMYDIFNHVVQMIESPPI